MTPESGGLGLLVGGVMFLGAYLGKRVLDRISDRTFVGLVEALVVGLGVLFLLRPPS